MEPEHRTRCLEFVTACRAEYDRLVSQGAPIPGFVIARYKRQFAEVHHKPEIVNVAVEEVGGGGGDHAGASVPHEAVQRPARPAVRDRRASTLLQDHIIDPGKAMRQAGPQVVVEPARVDEEADGPPAGMRRVSPPPSGTPQARRLSGMLPRFAMGGR